jgi:integrase
MQREKLTLERIRNFACPDGAQQAFLWDLDVPRLAVRATARSKSFVFETKLDRATIRMTIGDTKVWNLDQARAEARRLQTLVDRGIDPRTERAERLAAAAAKREKARRSEAPALEAWAAYLEARTPKWGAHHLKDHVNVSKEGGTKIVRGRKTGDDGKTKPGALRPLLELPLAKIDAALVRAWLQKEAPRRPTHAALAFRLLRGFLNWCSDQPEYQADVCTDACAGRIARDELPKRQAKKDALEREMLRPWFEQVRALPKPTHAAYLQIVLLIGARREEVAEMRWEDIDFRWKRITIRDKVDGERIVPLTPYVGELLRDLKRINDTPPPEFRILHGKKIRNDLASWKPSPWVFASTTSASGRLEEPRLSHNRALKAAGLPNITIHGLRRSFGTLSEWVEVPTGIVAQIMGHAPSATAEKHYRVRPIDLLRLWHARIEAWILAEAGIEQPNEDQAAPALRVAS